MENLAGNFGDIESGRGEALRPGVHRNAFSPAGIEVHCRRIGRAGLAKVK
jgi:hypothetical protein